MLTVTMTVTMTLIPNRAPKPCLIPTPAGKGDPPEPVFAKGMCRACFVEYVRAIGGADGCGADPPAFARAMQRELAAQQAEEVCRCAL